MCHDFHADSTLFNDHVLVPKLTQNIQDSIRAIKIEANCAHILLRVLHWPSIKGSLQPLLANHNDGRLVELKLLDGNDQADCSAILQLSTNRRGLLHAPLDIQEQKQ